MNQLLVIWVPSPFRSHVIKNDPEFVCNLVILWSILVFIQGCDKLRHLGRIKSMQQIQMYTNVLYANLESFAQLAQKVAFLPNSTAHVATTFPWGALLGWWSSQWSVGLWPCGQRLPRRYLLCFQDVLSFRNVFKDWVWKSSPATKNPCTSSLQKIICGAKGPFSGKDPYGVF